MGKQLFWLGDQPVKCNGRPIHYPCPSNFPFYGPRAIEISLYRMSFTIKLIVPGARQARGYLLRERKG